MRGRRSIASWSVPSHACRRSISNAAAAFHTTGQGTDLDVLVEKGVKVPLRFFARRDNSGGLLIAAFRREAGADEESAAAAENRLARFFQSSPFGIATIGSDGRLVSTNAAFARMIDLLHAPSVLQSFRCNLDAPEPPSGSTGYAKSIADMLCVIVQCVNIYLPFR